MQLDKRMTKRTFQFSLRLAMFATTLIPISLFWFWTRPAHVAFSLNGFRTERFTLPPDLQHYSPDGFSMRFAAVTLTNTSPYTVWYIGIAGRPNCTVSQHMRSTDSWFQCGNSTTPSGWVPLYPGEAVDFSCQFDDDSKALKVGVELKGALFGTPKEQWGESYVVPHGQVTQPKPKAPIDKNKNDTDRAIAA